MTHIVDARSAFWGTLVVPSTTGLTASGDGTGIDISKTTSPFVVDITVGTVGGTATPTCVFTVQESSDNVTFTSVAGALATVTVTAAGAYQLFVPNALKQYVRLDYVITGTNPVFPVSARVVAQHHITGTGAGYSTSPQA